jgi:protein-tyrosine phosphatase
MLENPPRVLPLQGASNCRDLGGYVGHDGRPLRWRRLLRSDHLARLTPADRAALRDIGLACTLDFRGVDERAAAPYAIDGVAQHALTIEPSVAQRMHALAADRSRLTVPAVRDLMVELYLTFVDTHAHRFAQMFDHLLQADGAVLFHCTAGKDRTGFAALLLLSALGVSRETIVEDYLLTNTVYRPPFVARPGDPADEALAVIWRVEKDYLVAALEAIDRAHGSMDHYLRGVIGLNNAAFQALDERFLAR